MSTSIKVWQTWVECVCGIHGYSKGKKVILLQQEVTLMLCIAGQKEVLSPLVHINWNAH